MTDDSSLWEGLWFYVRGTLLQVGLIGLPILVASGIFGDDGFTDRLVDLCLWAAGLGSVGLALCWKDVFGK